MKWAIKFRYLESRYNGDGKWHTHRTKWHDDLDDAWREKEEFERKISYKIDESQSIVIRKEIKC